MTAEDFLNQYDPSNKKTVSQEPKSSASSFLDQYDPSINKNLDQESSGFLRQAADIPLKVAQGGISSVKSFTDLFGADNAMSKELAGYEKWVGSLVSAESKKDDEEIARILKDAENKGVYDKVIAGLEAFAKAPLEMTAQSVGYMVPQLAAGALGKAAQFTKAGIIGTQAALGFAQGVGQAKGDIYESTLDYLRKQGVPENVANDKAIEAQATLGKNLDQILLSGGLNALASTTGAEAIATRILTKQGKEATGGAIKGFLKGVAAESPLEAIQSAQQEVAKNVAQQREGGDVPTFKGAIESATTGAVAGAFIGGPLGAFEAMSAEQKAEIDITKEADRKARDLEAPDTATQAIAAAITNLERGIDNKRKDLDVLETTSPEAAKLRLDIAADQKILAQSKEQANKLGLSETITEAEKKIIAPEVVPPVTEVPTTEVVPEVVPPVTGATPPTEITPEVVPPTEIVATEIPTAEVPATQITTTPEVSGTIQPVEEVTKENFTPQKETIKVLNELTTIDRAALSGRLLSEGLITRAEALYNLQQASNEGITSQQISASRVDAEQKWNDKTRDGILAGRSTAAPTASADIAIKAENARKNKRIVARVDALNPTKVIGMTARQALKHASELNVIRTMDTEYGEAIWRRDGSVVKPNYALMQDAAAIIAEQDIPILDREKIVSLSSRGLRGRAVRFNKGDIGIPSTKNTSVGTLVHEVAHTLTVDRTNQVAPRNAFSGREYIDLLNQKIADKKIEEPIRRLMGLYISTLEQLGIMDQYGKNNGLAGTKHPDTSVNAARRLQGSGKLRGDLNPQQLYGLANIEEFIAQTFSEPTFRDLLKTLKNPNTKKSIYREFVQAIKDLFGFTSDSMAAAVIDATFDIAKRTTLEEGLIANKDSIIENVIAAGIKPEDAEFVADEIITETIDRTGQTISTPEVIDLANGEVLQTVVSRYLPKEKAVAPATVTPAVSETITPAAEPAAKPEDKRYNPLGYDIADVVEDVKAGKTDTPLRAINQVVEQASQLRDRVKAESERRQQSRKRGKAAILERVARERSAGKITEKTAQALTDFVNRIREDAIGDTAISIRENGISNYDFADNLVTFFLNQDKGNLGREVAVHEFWHGLSRFLPEAEVEQINKDYVRELASYLKKNPWFLAFVGRYTLTPDQYEAYKFFNPKEAETKLTPILDDRGNIIKYKIKFDKDNYRYIMLDEFIAEKMTDLVLGKQAIPDTFLGKLAKVFREFLALIKTKLGIDPYEKFYQLATDTNERLTLQRESGVAPPIQIYEPQEYDYSTRRMMAAEQAPIEPEAETITEAMGQGLDIGKEDNMPINNKIESHIKNFAVVRGFFESASDRLRRAGFKKLATGIDDYYDQAQRRLGFANKILLPAFDEYAKQSKANKAKIDEEVKMFYAAQENKRDTAEFFDELNPITQKIVTAWQKFGEESGKDNQRIGIKVFDRGLQRFRPIGRVDKFFPRILKPKYKQALMEPDKYQKEYNEIVEALMKSGRIEKPEDAERYISNYEGTGTQKDYFSGIESARGQALPEELYDYSMQVMTDYVARWSQHASRIEQFGQKLGENSMTLWDRSRASTRDRRTIDYITAAQERVEGYFPNDPFQKGMAALNIWASGLQLGNPASATMNMVGGTTLNAMIGQPGAASSYVESLIELRKLGSNLKDAREKGIISRDLMNIVGDHQEVLDQNGIAKVGQKTADFLLKWSGFTPVEQMIRTQSLIIGKSFLRKTLSSYSQNPDSLFSKQASTWLSRNNFDIDKLLVEQGSGPETDKLMRYFATASQGGYTISQTPIFIDTPTGKFLFKYQKFSTQVMRQAWKNTFEPAWKAVTFKGETMQLPSETRQLLYRLRLAEAKEIGDNRKISLDEIPQKVSKAEAKALTLIPVMMWLASAYVGGEAILRLRDVLFGVMMKGPDYEDILKALEDDEDDDELYLGLQRAWYNLIGIGALGLIGNYGQFFMDWQDRERVKNPLDPPALSLLKETGTLITNVADQGTLTKGDINNYLNRMSSMYRVSQKLYQTSASGLGFSDAPTVAEEMYRREVADINKYARRWAESAGLEYRTKRPMDIAPSKMTPINREISSYLQRNDPVTAAAYAKEYLKTLPKEDRKNAIQSMESGARNRQPLRLGSGPMDEAEKKAFLKWAKTKMSPEKYAAIEKLAKQYESNRKKFLMRLPNR
jgi:hypothetical protein